MFAPLLPLTLSLAGSLAPLPPVTVGVVAVDRGDVDVDAANAAARAAAAAAGPVHGVSVVDPDALRLREATRGCGVACRTALVARRGAAWALVVDVDGDATVIALRDVRDGRALSEARLDGPRFRRTADVDAAVLAAFERARPAGVVARDRHLARAKAARSDNDVDAAAAAYAAAFFAVDDDDSVDLALTWLRALDERAALTRDAAWQQAAARITASTSIAAAARARFAAAHAEHLVDVAERLTAAAEQEAQGPDHVAATSAACRAWRDAVAAAVDVDGAARANAAEAAVCVDVELNAGAGAADVVVAPGS